MLPGEPIQPRRRYGFRGVDVNPVIRKAEHIPRDHESEDLPPSVFRVAADAYNAFIDRVDEMRVLAFRENRQAAAPELEHGCNGGQLLLFLGRQRIVDIRWP